MSNIIFDKIAALLSSKKGLSKEMITIESSFEELGLDSLDAIELIADLEDEFNVTIANSDIQGIKSVRQAAEGLSKAMNA
jgi:acyl carrier protein